MPKETAARTPRNPVFYNRVRKTLILFFHLLVASFSLLLAFSLRYDLQIPTELWPSILEMLPVVLLLKLVVFRTMGMADGWWRYVSIPDLLQILKANVVASFGVVLYAVFIREMNNLPRSVIILDFLVCFMTMIGVRVLVRILREQRRQLTKSYRRKKKSVLVVGSGIVAQTIVREMRENPKMLKAVLGFIDRDQGRKGKVFNGIPVLGTLDDMAKICGKNDIDLIIVAESSVQPKELRNIVAFCKENKIESKILPAMGDIISGQVSLQHCREVRLEDLLGRPPIRLDVEEINNYLHGKRVLVTGAAGSIGSEICRQVAQFGPGNLVMFENAETPLFHLENELREKFPGLSLIPSLSDIRDQTRVSQVFKKHRPQVVFHAAAYKHVPMSEINPVQVVKNNVLGTRNIIDASFDIGAEHFVLISTDKAVNPTNIMGTTKRVAEMYAQSLPRNGSTKATTVRFGNVLGSHGSVIPIFREQILKGGPVTVTHPEITRFFMTIPEAVQLVLQAGCMGYGGEIFLLDMGEPVKIIRLAEEMIRLSGRRPYEDIEITFTGLRAGEKLFEELLIDGEGIKPTVHEKIRVLEATSSSCGLVKEETELLFEAIRRGDQVELIRLLKNMVPEFHTTQNLVHSESKPGEGTGKGINLSN
ncbi:NAD-dependent nucleoside diphosphate-sugar epimerase/dehydratase [Syntrophotalea carbinolica DSM 2380]|uniref:NAD-dependent nucleoside diphosphate-sugar epimerase/dehydratase n=1 Tax=Syntrophotalea carbinolica (strain DSM 2380 / NBRC 103641 / GraBd1) TaxID=338963 RepID=Q3A4C6_SYNC1|nr:nucleoside-diphosphate sugar epimerase/dehydratase [Syntrophotalea carbinolica]ABA88781.1 NAD-dependent nucleoside diphosphate-sugar epimerase/dehydratase [Syntrophotalea carbinolica DSM 2380]